MRCRLKILEDMKKKALDNNAHIDDLGEAIWILQHHRPFDHKYVLPIGNDVSFYKIKSICKSDLEGRGGRFATSNILKNRRLMLPVFGMIHIETTLEQAI